MTDLKFMASDGNMYPAEWFGNWQSFDICFPPTDVLLNYFPSIANATHWTLESHHPLQKPPKIYDQYLDESGDFDFRFFQSIFYARQVIFDHPKEAFALIAFIKDNVPKG